jgi:hypothetical protein
MARGFFHDFRRPDGAAVTVEYTFHSVDGSLIVAAFNRAGKTVSLGVPERERYEQWLDEHHAASAAS